MTDWRDIPGFPGYQANRLGGVRSLLMKDRWGGVKPRPTPYQMTPRETDTGYVRYCVRVDGKTRTLLAHRAVALAWLGEPPDDKPCVAHLDGNRTNNALENLSWVSYQENSDQMRGHGTVLLGEGNPQSVLTASSVVDIRRRLCRDESMSDIARRYSVSVQTISSICYNKRWTFLPPTPTAVIRKRRQYRAMKGNAE